MVVTIKLKKCSRSESSTKKSGNTKQISPAKHWCFTLNNYNSSDITDIINTVERISSNKYVFQEEKGENGTPHLQGYIDFGKKLRPKKLFTTRIHWEKCRNIKASIAYCSKEETRVGKIYKNFKLPRKLIKMTYDRLFINQRKIADLFTAEPTEFMRKIYWFWEEKGNWGKSVLCRYFIDCQQAMVVQGASKDILCGLAAFISKNDEAPNMVIFDVPRTSKNHVSYSAIESILNGYFFSGKYESGMSRFNPPHLIIFANEEPEYEKCSADRWVVEELK